MLIRILSETPMKAKKAITDISLHAKSFNELTMHERRQVSQLHLKRGQMMPLYRRIRKNKPEEKRIFLCKREDEVLGWSITYNRNLHIWVRPKYRRQHLGKKLIKFAAINIEKEFMVIPWDGVSTKFFSNVGKSIENLTYY